MDDIATDPNSTNSKPAKRRSIKKTIVAACLSIVITANLIVRFTLNHEVSRITAHSADYCGAAIDKNLLSGSISTSVYGGWDDRPAPTKPLTAYEDGWWQTLSFFNPGSWFFGTEFDNDVLCIRHPLS